MRRSWFWHISEYLIQTWRVILLQNNSNCCRLKAAFYQKVPFSQPFLLPERNLLLRGTILFSFLIPSVVPKKGPGKHDRLTLLEGAGSSLQQRVIPWLERGGHSKMWGAHALTEAPTGGAGSAVSSPKFSSHYPNCYPRALSWLKQSLKAGSWEPG